MSEFRLREFRESDEARWLRCRVLGFLDTSYFDDVWRVHPGSTSGWSLVGVLNDEIVGICEASPAAHGATVDTVVVHPDHRRTGLASALLDELFRRLEQSNVRQVDAWTRDDSGTLAWYRACGFEVRYRYLHVFADGEAEMASAATELPGLNPRSGFFHADTQDAVVEVRHSPPGTSWDVALPTSRTHDVPRAPAGTTSPNAALAPHDTTSV